MITNSAYLAVDQRGTLDTSTAQTLGIDVSGMAAILNILTNMYSSPALAVVREYSCNARDSHVEAGKADRPIHVKLPTPIDPQLKIQDYGMGLSEGEILNVYARYGSSTKRASNELIGAMGIGSKSAFTVGNQFTVTGIKDGIKTIALFSLNAQGEPTVNILVSGAETDEPNGVLVDIGVENVNAVNEAAEKMFATWKPGTVLVNGQAPEHIWDHESIELIHESPDLEVHILTGVQDNYGFGYSKRFTLIMGGIAYELNTAAFVSLRPEMAKLVRDFDSTCVKFYMTVPIGAVDITPSREELRVTPTTTHTLDSAISRLADSFNEWVSSKVGDAPTFTDAAVALRIVRNAIGGTSDLGKFNWRGRSFKSRIEMPYFYIYNQKRSNHYNSPVVTRIQAKTVIDLRDDLTKKIVVTNVPENKQSTVRRYVKTIFEERGYKTGEYHVIVSPLDTEEIEWFSYGNGGPVETITYDAWREMGRKNFIKNSGGKSAVTYDVYGESDPMTVLEILEDGSPVAFEGYRRNGFQYRTDFQGEALKGYTYIMLRPQQTEEAFLKRIPNAKRSGKIVQEAAIKIVNGMTAEDRLLLNSNAYYRVVNTRLFDWIETHEKEITNQEVTNQIKLYKEAKANIGKDRARLTELVSAINVSGMPNVISQAEESGTYLQDNYPLVAQAVNYSWARTADSKMVQNMIQLLNVPTV